MQVTLHEITLAYDRQPALLDHFSCTLPDGKLVALLGPSGSGKSTILNLLAGLLTPQAGQIFFDQTDVTTYDSRQRNIGMVFQDYALYPHLTVRDNIAFPLKMARFKKAARYQRVAELADLVQLTDQLGKFPQELSGGQQQRVAIARALAKHPALLLLDEPLSSLDTALREELRTVIHHIQRQTGVTTLLVTHDQEDALQIADEIMVLAHGRLQQIGTGQALYQSPHNLTVAQFIGRPQINLCAVTNLPATLRTLLPAAQLAQATTLGIRSEAVHVATTPSPLTAALTAQVRLGRDTQSHLHTSYGDFISTAIAPTTATAVPLTIDRQGCLLFDAQGACLWSGGDDLA
ncbi:ABC transporter ATP-binding protein [Levilactobacillus suantsaiihabitans]|uniref:ABC transporter ATP-binding protein n=1 Tax=Levilactobacillus suantsaiihabitans TaxID=2487722 RepID=A0A4Z0JDB5_9LACO|nr:ABC transporter ATP-binding protein [Levilactobacillus suantsaiihabitans]TGD20452.1 ABC transporter ATP-binding protein [Levilactobacillus suantsaiihabitans]